MGQNRTIGEQPHHQLCMVAVELPRRLKGQLSLNTGKTKGFALTAPPLQEGLLKPRLLSYAPEFPSHFSSLLFSPIIWSRCSIPVSADAITSYLTEMRGSIRQEGLLLLPPIFIFSFCNRHLVTCTFPAEASERVVFLLPGPYLSACALAHLLPPARCSIGASFSFSLLILLGLSPQQQINSGVSPKTGKQRSSLDCTS